MTFSHKIFITIICFSKKNAKLRWFLIKTSMVLTKLPWCINQIHENKFTMKIYYIYRYWWEIRLGLFFFASYPEIHPDVTLEMSEQRYQPISGSFSCKNSFLLSEEVNWSLFLTRDCQVKGQQAQSVPVIETWSRSLWRSSHTDTSFCCYCHDSVHVIVSYSLSVLQWLYFMWTDAIKHIPDNNSDWLSVFLSS